eukprot:955333-Alexandrium_andersonii.AAC.1
MGCRLRCKGHAGATHRAQRAASPPVQATKVRPTTPTPTWQARASTQASGNACARSWTITCIIRQHMPQHEQ